MQMTDNPFFEAWDTPFGLPPFERIGPEHFPPAFDRGMAEQAAEIAAIAGSPEPADFANTIEALERSGGLLRRVGRVFHNLTSSATTAALDRIDRDYAPKLAAHRIKIMLDPALFARIDALWRARDRLGLLETGRDHLGPARTDRRTRRPARCLWGPWQGRAARPDRGVAADRLRQPRRREGQPGAGGPREARFAASAAAS